MPDPNQAYYDWKEGKLKYAPIEFEDKSFSHFTPEKRAQLWDSGLRPARQGWAKAFPDDNDMRVQFVDKGELSYRNDQGLAKPQDQWTKQNHRDELRAYQFKIRGEDKAPLPHTDKTLKPADRYVKTIQWFRDNPEATNRFDIGSVAYGAAKRLPLNFGILDWMEMGYDKAAMDRMYEGKATDADYYKLAKSVVASEQEEEDPFEMQALRQLSHLPGMAADYYLMGPFGSMGKKAASQAAGKLLKHYGKKKFKEFMKKAAVKKVAGAGLEAGMYATVMRGGTTMGEAIPTRDLKFDETTETGFAKTEKDSWFNTLPKSIANQMIEYSVERFGGAAIGKLAGRGRAMLRKPGKVDTSVIPDDLMNLMKKRAVTAWKIQNPGRSGLLAKIGYNGMINEMGEEQLTEALQGVNEAFFATLPGYERDAGPQIDAKFGVAGDIAQEAGYQTGLTDETEAEAVERRKGMAKQLKMQALGVGLMGGAMRGISGPRKAGFTGLKDPILSLAARDMEPARQKDVDKYKQDVVDLIESQNISRKAFESVRLPDAVINEDGTVAQEATTLYDHYRNREQRQGFLDEANQLKDAYAGLEREQTILERAEAGLEQQAAEAPVEQPAAVEEQPVIETETQPPTAVEPPPTAPVQAPLPTKGRKPVMLDLDTLNPDINDAELRTIAEELIPAMENSVGDRGDSYGSEVAEVLGITTEYNPDVTRFTVKAFQDKLAERLGTPEALEAIAEDRKKKRATLRDRAAASLIDSDQPAAVEAPPVIKQPVLDMEQDNKNVETVSQIGITDVRKLVPGRKVNETDYGFDVFFEGGRVPVYMSQDMDLTKEEIETVYNQYANSKSKKFTHWKVDKKSGKVKSFTDVFPTVESYSEYLDARGGIAGTTTASKGGQQGELGWDILATVRINDTDWSRANRKQMNVLRHELVHVAHLSGMWNKAELAALMKEYKIDSTSSAVVQSEGLASNMEVWNKPGMLERFTDWINRLMNKIMPGKFELKPSAVKNLLQQEKFWGRQTQEFSEFVASQDQGKQQDVSPVIAGMPESGDYRGIHQAPRRDDYHASMDNMTAMYPEDIYSDDGARLYGSGRGDQHDRQVHQIIKSVRDNPDAMVTVYRGVPGDVQDGINPGDWVTPVRQYAEDHALRYGDDIKIIEKQVRAGDLFTEANSLYEFGWDPETKPTDDITLGMAEPDLDMHGREPGQANQSPVNPGISPEARGAYDVADAAREKTVITRETVKLEVDRRRSGTAQERAAADEAALEKWRNNPNDFDVFEHEHMIRWAEELSFSKKPGDYDKAIEIILLKREAVAMQARSVAYGKDPYRNNPILKRYSSLQDAIFKTSREELARFAQRKSKDPRKAKAGQRAYNKEEKRIAKVRKYIEKLGYAFTKEGLRRLARNRKDAYKVAQVAVRSKWSYGTWANNLFSEYTYGSMLSGLNTQVVNLLSNTTWGFAMELEQFGAATMNSVFNNSQNITLQDYQSAWNRGEVKYKPEEMGVILKTAFKNGWARWKTEQAVLEEQIGVEEQTKMERNVPAIPGAIGKGFRFIHGFGPMAAVDQFYKTLFTHMDVGVHAFSLARQQVERFNRNNPKRKQMTQEDINRIAEEMINDKQSQAWLDSLEQAEQKMFQDEGGYISKRILGLAKTARGLPFGIGAGFQHLVAPFVKTPVRLMGNAVIRLPGFGTVVTSGKMLKNYKDGKHVLDGVSRELVGQLAVGLLGTAIAMGVSEDEEETMFTGAKGSLGKESRSFRYHEGVAPSQGVKLFGQWVQYDRFDPFAVQIAAIVDGVHALKSGKGVGVAIKDVGWSTAASIQEKSFTRSLGDLMKLVEDDDKGQRFIASALTRLYPNLYQQISRAKRPTIGEKRGETVFEEFTKRAELAPSEDIHDPWGRKAESAGWSPIKHKGADTFVGDRVFLNWNRLNPDVTRPKYPTRPSRDYRREGVDRRMDDKTYAEYARLAGTLSRNVIEKMVSPEMGRNPSDRIMAMVESSLSRGRVRVKDHLHKTGKLEGFDMQREERMLQSALYSSMLGAMKKKRPIQYGQPVEEYQEELDKWQRDRDAAMDYAKWYRQSSNTRIRQ